VNKQWIKQLNFYWNMKYFQQTEAEDFTWIDYATEIAFI